jgi:hypothetical protein
VRFVVAQPVAGAGLRFESDIGAFPEGELFHAV